MELAEALRTRRSVREYAARPVEKATLEKLLKVATQAPSASNSQPWAFGIIQGAEKLRAYSDRAKAALLDQTGPDAPRPELRARLSDPAVNIFHDAPVLVCIYARTPGFWARTDCAMAAYTLMLAAHDLGLGTCWIGLARTLFGSPEFQRELGVPADYAPVGQLVLGYPEGELPAPRPRAAPEVLFWEE